MTDKYKADLLQKENNRLTARVAELEQLIKDIRAVVANEFDHFDDLEAREVVLVYLNQGRDDV